MAKRIEAVIDLDGNVEFDVLGAHGVECEQLTAEMEKALGVATKKIRKSEYREKNITRDQESRM